MFVIAQVGFSYIPTGLHVSPLTNMGGLQNMDVSRLCRWAYRFGIRVSAQGLVLAVVLAVIVVYDMA